MNSVQKFFPNKSYGIDLKKFTFLVGMLSNEHIGKKYLDRLKESNAINLENNYKILIVKNKYIQILPLNNNILHSDPNKSKRHVD